MKRRAVLWLTCVVSMLFVLTGADAQSPKRTRQQPTSAQNAPTAQPPAADQRGTDQVPLIVKTLPAEKPKDQTEKEERERIEKSKIDEKLAFETQRIADYTDRLVLFTTFLFCVAVVQAGLFVWQLWLILKSLDDTKKAATAAETSANTAQQQIELASAEFNSTHRPRMRLKHAWFVDPTEWRVGGPLEINLDFVNIGSGTAHVGMVNYQSIILLKGARLPQRPPYDEVPPSGVRITRFPTVIPVTSGVTLARPVCDGILAESDVRDILQGDKVLYLIGTIEYLNVAGRHLRQTAFCRHLTFQRYPPGSEDAGRFYVVEDPDYEYED